VLAPLKWNDLIFMLAFAHPGPASTSSIPACRANLSSAEKNCFNSCMARCPFSFIKGRVPLIVSYLMVTSAHILYSENWIVPTILSFFYLEGLLRNGGH